MGEIIARTSCPICGEPEQNIKINKNGNLYMYCDNRCSVRFNPRESRQAIDQLRTGAAAKVKNMVLVPVYVQNSEKNASKNAKNGQKTQKNNIFEVKNDEQSRDYGRNTIIGRADEQHSGVAANKPARGLLDWLLDDDDDN